MINLLSMQKISVLDLSYGMAGALIASQLRSFGAKVVRIEPEGGDPFYEIYPAYAAWHGESVKARPGDLEKIAGGADICIVGGEDYPGFSHSVDVSALRLSNPRLLILDIKGDISADSRCPAVDILVQARSGHCYEQFTARPILTAFPAPTYGAVLLGLINILSALIERERTQAGRLLSTSLRQGVALWWSADWSSAERPDTAFLAVIPKDVRQLIFRCRDGHYVHIVLGIPGAVAKLFKVLNIDLPADPVDRGLPDASRPPKEHFFADTDLLERHVALQDQRPLLEALWREGIAAEGVEEPGAIWDDEQTQHGGFVVAGPDGSRHIGTPVAIEATGTDCVANKNDNALRIVDLGNFLAGPYASRIPAGLGIDVIKVEPPGGDPNRYIQRSFASGSRGKRSIGINAKIPKGIEIIRQLCTTANAVHHNFRPGVAARLGLDAPSLRALRADIVMVQSSGYGSTGPKALNSGFDMIMQACCGLEFHGAGKGNVPLWYRSPLVDYGCGSIGTIALLLGLFEQIRCGHGADAETSLLGSGLFMLSELIQTAEGKFAGVREMNAERTGFHPTEQLYQTVDGWIAIAARSPGMADAFATCLDLRETLGPSDSWDSVASKAIGAVIATMSSDEALQKLRAAGVWVEKCEAAGWQATVEDPVLRASGLVGEIQDEKLGAVLFVDQLIDRMPGLEQRILDKVPGLGEHTNEIMGELGYAETDIRELRAEGVIF